MTHLKERLLPAAVQEQAVSGVGAVGTGPQAVNAFAGPSGTSTSIFDH